MRLINLIPLQEIDFPSQAAFDTYSKAHKLRPDTKVVVAGRVTTAGRAAQNSPSPVKGTSVFSKDNTKNIFHKQDKPKDLESSVTNHLNKISGGKGYTQKDEGGAIAYNMGDGDTPTYTLYMGKEGNKHSVTLEPTYGNDPKKLQGKIDKSFDNPKDAINYMGDIAKKHRKELEMDDSQNPLATDKDNNGDWMDDLDSIDVSDIKGKATPDSDSWKHDDVFGATFKDPKTGKTTTVGDAYDREDDSPAYQKAFAYVSQFDPDGEAIMGTKAYDDLNKQAMGKAGSTNEVSTKLSSMIPKNIKK